MSEPVSNPNWKAELISESRAILADCREIIESVREVRLKEWQRDAGPLLPRMLDSREYAWEQLRNKDPKIRRVALGILSHHWRLGKDLSAISEHMAFHDDDSDVRGVALVMWASCHRGTDDKRIGRHIASIVEDETMGVRRRCTAYYLLFTMRGLKPPMREGKPAVTDKNFEEVRDREFIRSFFEH